MSRRNVTIVDYGIGNFSSVMNTVRRIGHRCRVSDDREILATSDVLILPGVGAFPAAMEHLRTSGLDQFLSQRADAGQPLIGLCLGMQLLADESVEYQRTTGLGLVPGRVVPLDQAPWHIGWNAIENVSRDPLLKSTDGRAVYFNHSYVLETPAEFHLCTTRLKAPFPSGVRRGNVVGLQFHEEFRDELRRSKQSLEDVAGKRVRAFRAPGFSLTPACSWAFDILVEEGFEVDCSIFPARRAHGGFPGFTSARPLKIWTASGELREFPMNTARIAGRDMVFSGGGYFRLLPLPLLQRLWRRSDYTMTYFHPRDFEPDQPYLPGLGPVRRFKSYYGLASAEAKLRAILEEFQFESVEAAERQVDWAAVPLVRLS